MLINEFLNKKVSRKFTLRPEILVDFGFGVSGFKIIGSEIVISPRHSRI